MKVHNPFRVAFVATLGVGLGLLLIGSIQTLSTILLYVGTALFLSLGLDPIVALLERRRLPRWVAVLITILGGAGGLRRHHPDRRAGPRRPDVAARRGRSRSSWTRADDLGRDRELGPQRLPEPRHCTPSSRRCRTGPSKNAGSITGGVIGAGVALFAGLGGAFIVLILTIYFTASTPNLKRAVYQLVPASKRERFIDLGEQITDSVGYYVMGQVTLGVINGVLSAIFLTIIEAPFPAVLAVIAFFFSLIPLVGTLTGSTIIVLTCLIPGLGSPTTALIAAIYYLIYMQIEAYVLSPRIMNRAVSVPGAVVVIAALAGGSLLGLLGALIAIPVAASILIIYRQVVIPRQNER